MTIYLLGNTGLCLHEYMYVHSPGSTAVTNPEAITETALMMQETGRELNPWVPRLQKIKILKL